MKRLGYTHFVAQGGDWGALITEHDGRCMAPPELLGIHTNMAGAVPPEIVEALRAGEARAAGLSADEKLAPTSGSTSSSRTAWPTRRDGAAPADAVRHRGFAGRPGRLVPRPRPAELRS